MATRKFENAIDFYLNPMPREEAQLLGLTRYYDGGHCKHGHFSQRYTSNGCCCRCMTLLRRERTANRSPARKEKELKGHRDYWKNNKDDINARRRARTANLTKAGLKERREKDREYREAHREIINARRRARRASLSEAELEIVREKDRARRRHAQKRKGDK